MRKAVLLDRDGTINFDYGYLHDPAQVEFLPNAIEALRILQSNGFILIIITNQSGIGRGYFSTEEYHKFHNHFIDLLSGQGVEISATYMCPHSPNHSCNCRKPNPYMALQAIEQYDIDPHQSYMLGDKESDVECGTAAGLTALRVTKEHDLLYWTNKIIERGL